MQRNSQFRDSVIEDYEHFSRSFVTIQAEDIKNKVNAEYNEGKYWPAPLIQINPNYKTAETISQLVDEKPFEPECKEIFRINKQNGNPEDLLLYTHQKEAIALALEKQSYIVTTGTGSEKALPSLYLL